MSSLGLCALGKAHLPPGAQMGCQFLLEHTARLDKETEIDRFMRYAPPEANIQVVAHFRLVWAVGSIGERNTLVFCKDGVWAMKQRRRIYYLPLSDRRFGIDGRLGSSMKSIGRRFDRASSSVFSVISPAGGIRPADRRRHPNALSLGEREEISRGLSTRRSLRAIAHLGRSPSTISREVLHNGGPDRYRAARSDQAAWDRALRPNSASWLAVRSWPAQYRPSCSGSGRLSRLPAGSSAPTQGSRITRCHTKRSIAACSSRRAGC